MQIPEIKEFFTGVIPPVVKRFAKDTGRGINNNNMIKENDRILIGISGGKDSLALSLALSLRRKWLPINYTLKALAIEWKEHPISDINKEKLFNFFETIEIPFEIVSATMKSESFRGKFNCYLCSRNRKRILFNIAGEQGFEKIALGHHLDDIIETTLINLFFRGSFATMLPVQSFFNGKHFIIRPMCEVKENTIINIAKKFPLPIYSNECPFKDTNLRSIIKPIIKDLLKHDKHVREHIYNSTSNINLDYLPFKQYK